MKGYRENWLRAIEFRSPEWIPCNIHFSPGTWRQYREALEAVVLAHPRIFPFHEKGSVNFDELPPAYQQGHFRDNWGCLWYTHPDQEGLEGQVVGHPLADWKALNTYQPPDVETKSEREDRDWSKVSQELNRQRARGMVTVGNGERLFDRLYLLRGFTDLMMDIATDDPHLPALIRMVWDHELTLTAKWLKLGVDAMYFHTDIGTQKGMMISPEKFRKYIKPMFRDIFGRCRQAGAHVLLSSDGNILEIVDDLIECGVSRHDPQFAATTLVGIEKHYKGKLCASVDLDRQSLPFTTARALRNQVREIVECLRLPEGGLMLQTDCNPDVPLENIEALCCAMEEFCF